MRFALLMLCCLFSSPSFAAWIVKQNRAETKTTVLSVDWIIKEMGNTKSQVLRSVPITIREDQKNVSGIYEEILYENNSLPKNTINYLHRLADSEEPSALSVEEKAASEMRTLVKQGDPANRIDLTILADGYTLEEKDKFFEDAVRITNDLFKEQTFASYLPLFNVHAVFVPSKDSGITDTQKKNTAFGLYRDPKGSKRAILPGKERAARQALRMAPDTDYPLILANDNFYGGLGGEFAITTRSLESGSMVLRHELGHNFGEVGEEYDSGFVYQGANFSSSSDVSWKEWLTDKNRYKAQLLSGEYLWQDLRDYPAEFSFDFPNPNEKGHYQFWGHLSTVGWATPEDVHVFIDGQRVEYSGLFTEDRSFFNLQLNQSLKPGKHTIRFEENIKERSHVLAFASLYALEADYNLKTDVHAAFPVFMSPGEQVGYRPTHESCLMRNMRIKNFCSVDKENMWLKFFARIELIDSLRIEDRKVTVELPKLEGLGITWNRKTPSGIEVLPEYQNRNHIEFSDEELKKGRNFLLKVTFKTDEIRKKEISMTKEFQIEDGARP